MFDEEVGFMIATGSSRKSFLRPDPLWAFRHFPMPILGAGLLTLWALASSFERSLLRKLPFADHDRLLLMLLLAFLAATVAGFATLRNKASLCWVAQGAAFLFGLSVGAALSEIQAPAVPLFFLSFGCFLPLATSHAARQGASGFWLANINLAANFAFCLVALGIALLGGRIVLSALKALLMIRVDDLSMVLTILACCFAFPVLWFSLAHICEKEMVEDEQGNLLYRAVSMTTDVLLIPLMLALGAIIHVYAARIALLAELPKGQIGWIVPTYLLIGYGVFFLAHNPSVLLPRLRAFFRVIWVPSTLAPLVLLALATATRINAYGVTEERYLLLCVVGGGALFAALAVIRRPFDLRFIPLAAGLLTLIASIGPFSALDVSIRSQTERARAILTSVPPERWASMPDGGLSGEQQEQLVSAVEYLKRSKSNNLEALASVWPAHLSKERWLRTELTRSRSSPMRFSFQDSDATDLGPVTLFTGVYLIWNGPAREIKSGATTYTLRIEGRFVDIMSEGSLTRFDVSSLFTMEPSVSRQPTPLLRSIEGRKGDMIVRRFERTEGPSGPKLDDVLVTIVLY